MSPEYFLIPIVMSQTSNIIAQINTGIYLLDCLIILLLVLCGLMIDFSLLKHKLSLYIQNYCLKKHSNQIIMTRTNGSQSNKFRAVMYYISKLNDRSIYSLKEFSDYKWDDNDNSVEKHSEYSIEQPTKFLLDSKENIYGLLTTEHKESAREATKTIYIDYSIFTIYSETKSLLELQDWINSRLEEYEKYVRTKTSHKQMLITISGDFKEKKIEGVPFNSTIHFENSWFNQKDEILSKIDFFLNNKDWYEQRGIPYNLGILLWGEPGGGKTRFIKQLLNYTGRHGIDIKLNDELDFSKLKNILLKDTIGESYIIPQNKRIIIFEDIDAMGEVVKQRSKFINSDQDTDVDTNSENSDSGIFSKLIETQKKEIIEEKSKHLNNNLGYLLNMIDGLNECNGRIIIMTTNRLEYLDKALIRPGRIDIKIEFGKCSRYDILMMIKMFWKNESDNLSLTDIKDNIEKMYTSAEVINIFRSSNDFNLIKKVFLI
jgi:SpoVK/Ycf46/Vps4 family AAA+-type ATPase